VRRPLGPQRDQLAVQLTAILVVGRGHVDDAPDLALRCTNV
jgi:hypothetical protein